MDCPLCRTVEAIRDGDRAALIAELDETYALLGENQGSRGWCVLILKQHAEHLADLDPPRQQRIWSDVARVAGAIRRAFPHSGRGGGPPRINYECLCNLVPHIHWHLIPRHADDPEPAKPVWHWPEPQLRGQLSAEGRAALVAQLRAAL